MKPMWVQHGEIKWLTLECLRYLTSVGVLVTFTLNILGHWSLHVEILFFGEHWFLWLLGSELPEHVVFCSAEKGVVFGSPLTEEGIAQVSQLIEYLHKSKWLCLLSFYPSGYLSGPPQVSGADRVTSSELSSSRSLGLRWATVPQNCLGV